MLDKDVAAVLMSMDQNYWKNWGVSLLRRSNCRRSCFFDRKKCFASGRLKFEPPLMRFLAPAEVRISNFAISVMPKVSERKKLLKELEHCAKHIIISTPLGQEDDSDLDEILEISAALKQCRYLPATTGPSFVPPVISLKFAGISNHSRTAARSCQVIVFPRPLEVIVVRRLQTQLAKKHGWRRFFRRRKNRNLGPKLHFFEPEEVASSEK